MYKIGYKDASPIASKGAVAPAEAIGEASAYPIILSCTSLTSDLLFFVTKTAGKRCQLG